MAEGQGGERWAKAVRQIEGAARSGATRLDLSRLVDNCMVKNLTRNIMRRQLMHRIRDSEDGELFDRVDAFHCGR